LRADDIPVRGHSAITEECINLRRNLRVGTSYDLHCGSIALFTARLFLVCLFFWPVRLNNMMRNIALAAQHKIPDPFLNLHTLTRHCHAAL